MLLMGHMMPLDCLYTTTKIIDEDAAISLIRTSSHVERGKRERGEKHIFFLQFYILKGTRAEWKETDKETGMFGIFPSFRQLTAVLIHAN